MREASDWAEGTKTTVSTSWKGCNHRNWSPASFHSHQYKRVNCCFPPPALSHLYKDTQGKLTQGVCVFYFSLFLLICETSLDQCSSALLRHRHSHRCILAFAPNNTSAPPIKKTRTDFQFLTWEETQVARCHPWFTTRCWFHSAHWPLSAWRLREQRPSVSAARLMWALVATLLMECKSYITPRKYNQLPEIEQLWHKTKTET